MMKGLHVNSINYHGESAIQQEKDSFHPKLDLKKKLIKCYIWSMALYGDELGLFGM
jgi:hypothetical protein